MAGFMDWLGNNSEALGALSAGLLGGRNAQEQVSMGMQGLSGTIAANRQKNKTLQFLQDKDPELAQAVAAGAITGVDAYKAYLEKTSAKAPRNPFMAVGGNLYDTQNGQWISPPQGTQAEAPEYGLAPVWGKNAQGQTVLGQLSKNGTFQETKLPDGFTPTPGIVNSDLGTSILTRNSKTGETMGQTPKDLAGAEREKALGSAAGNSLASAPMDLQAGQNAKALIQDLRTDPNRERGTGMSSVLNRVPGTAGYDYQNKVEQAKSGAFLTAIQQMRGLGALSNNEGAAATSAVTRMDTATSEEAFQAALNDYEKIIDQGIARAQAKLNGATMPAQTPGAAAPQSPRRTTSGIQFSVEP